MIAFEHNPQSHRLSSRHQARHAVLLFLCDPQPSICERFKDFTTREWNQLLPWLDTSGLALYFFARISELHLQSLLPACVQQRLLTNCAENALRTKDLLRETASLCTEFKQHGIRFALVKGVSLTPESVPKPELRSQLDVDVLTDLDGATMARSLLEQRGYRLKAVSGNVWEFTSRGAYRTSLADLYKPSPHRSVEIHIASENSAFLLTSVQYRSLLDTSVPVLSPQDIFVGQALHAFKHICSEFLRTSHLLEFRRHVLHRRDDVAFWADLRRHTQGRTEIAIPVGTLILLITEATGVFAPEELTSWIVSAVPSSVRLWIERYGLSVVLASFPGNKLYLLLQPELEAVGLTCRRTVNESLLPRRLPPAIENRPPGETPIARMRSYWRQLSYITFRLWFHVTRNLEYFCSSLLFRRRVRRLA